MAPFASIASPAQAQKPTNQRLPLRRSSSAASTARWKQPSASTMQSSNQTSVSATRASDTKARQLPSTRAPSHATRAPSGRLEKP